MAHFAKLDSDKKVIAVHVVSNDALDPNNEESSGIAFYTEWSGGYTNWKQTSYNGNIRKNYAAVGYTYDEARDAFIPPKPFPSWTLDEESCTWQPPSPYPNDGKPYRWVEDDLNWQAIESA